MINCDGEEKSFRPEEISAKILAKLKLLAEQFTGSPVRRAVVSVPAHFNYSQRQATLDACCIAGLECSRLINPPSAAALAYFYEHNMSAKMTKNVLIFDFGGGTLDVSVIETDNVVL